MKTVSIKTVLAEIGLGFGFVGSDWIVNAMEWIPAAMSIIKTTTPLDKLKRTSTVENYKVALPCDMEELLLIVYNDTWLPLKGNSVYLKGSDTNLNENAIHFGLINNDYLQTSFETGDVDFYYYGYPTDSDGFPLIPDESLYKEALGWWVAYKLLLKGYKHQSIKDWKEAYQMWERLYPQAQNASKFPTINDVEKLTRQFNNLTRSSSITSHLVNEI